MLFSKKSAYLIDSENVGSTWESLLKRDEKFDLFIFVTENAKSMNFSLLRELTNDSRHRLEIIDSKTGKNNLDFHLSSYLGYLIGKNRYSSYMIVSQDTGYDNIIEYWKQQGYDVSRTNTKPETARRTRGRVLSRTQIEKNAKQPASRRRTTRKPAAQMENAPAERALLNGLLTSYSDNDIQEIKKVLDSIPAEKRNDRNHIYNALIHRFKKEKGLAVYTLIKKQLNRYYSLLKQQ
ncbi:MAG: hypothetical protein II126_02800 [Erysipelotrichaceae bacterium]|nr:hypothetical protein [Erysipelotrichaceae bacterium]